MYIKELTNEEFNKFTDNFKYYSIYQTSEYGLLMNNQNYDSIFIGFVDDLDNIQAGSLLLVEKKSGFKYAYAPKGFLIDYNDKFLLEDFTNQLKLYLSNKKIVAVKINPMIIRSVYDYNTNNYTYNEAHKEQLEFLKSLGYNHLGFNNLFESFKPRYTALLDIKKDIHTLFNGMNKAFKNKIKNADQYGIRIYKGSINELDYLYEEVKNKYPRNKKYFEDLMFYFSKRNMCDYYYAKLDTNAYLVYLQKKLNSQNEICGKLNAQLFKRHGQDNNKLIESKIKEENKLNEIKNELVYATTLLRDFPQGIILSTMIIIKYKNEVCMFMDGYNHKFKKLNAKHLMTWKLIEKYSKENYKIFNLGGMTNPTIENDKYKGLNEFKLRFNARCVEYIGDLELVCNNTLYKLYKNATSFKFILKRK